MRYRPFGNTGFECSEVGLGTWQFGGDWGNVSEQSALDILRVAVDEGVNFIDTADVYGLGVSESVIGKFWRSCDHPLFIATKLGRFPEPGWPANFTFEAMEGHVNASLKRLDMEALDLIQLHCIPTDELKKGDVFEHLRTLKMLGKIKAFGVSVETVEEGLVCLDQDDVTSLQVIFNIFRQKPARELFDAALKKGVAIIARVPLASGLLTGKFTKDTTFTPQDHRSYNKDGEAFNVGETFAGLPFDKGVQLAEGLRPMLSPDVAMSTPMSTLALRWILDHKAVATVIPGASSTDQVRGNVAASSLAPLSDEIHSQIAAYYDGEVAPHIRGPY